MALHEDLSRARIPMNIYKQIHSDPKQAFASPDIRLLKLFKKTLSRSCQVMQLACKLDP